MSSPSPQPHTKTTQSAPVAEPPVPKPQPTPASEADSTTTVVQRAVNAAGGNSPQTPPTRYGSLLEQLQGRPNQQKGVLKQLQRSYGNQYVGQVIQAKLTVGQPGDKYEEEADRIADRVMHMPEPITIDPLSITPLTPNTQHPTTTTQRQPDSLSDEDERKLEEETEKPTLQTKETPGQTPTVTPAIEAHLNASKGSGQPLPAKTRAFFESRFGQDFINVRIHSDASAARDLNAQAFTHKQDVYFGAGKYNPESGEGKRLLAHELTHVVQQKGVADDFSKQNFSKRPILSTTIIQRKRDYAPSAHVVAAQDTSMQFYLARKSKEILHYQQLLEWLSKKYEASPGNVKYGFELIIKGLIEEYVRVNAISLMASHRVKILNSKDRTFSFKEENYSESKTGAQKKRTVSIIRLVASKIAILEKEKNRLEEYYQELKKANRISRSSILTNQEIVDLIKKIVRNSNYKMKEDIRKSLIKSWKIPYYKMDPFLIPRELTRVHPKQNWARSASKILMRMREKQILGLKIALKRLYNKYPIFSQLKASEVVESKDNITFKALKAFSKVKQKVDDVIRDIASNDINPLDLPEPVRITEENLPIPLKGLLQEMKRDHNIYKVLVKLGWTIAEIALCLLPVIGPALSAALGFIGLAVETEDLLDRMLISEAEANPEKQENLLGVKAVDEIEIEMIGLGLVLTAVGLHGALKALKVKKIPRSAYSDELISAIKSDIDDQLGRTSRKTITETTQVSGSVAREIPKGYLVDIFEQTFGKEYKWKDILHLHTTHRSFRSALRKIKGEGEPLAFFDPSTGQIHIGPNVTNLKEVFHEAIHKVAYSKNPQLRSEMGEFLYEGMTERLAQRMLGRSVKENVKGFIYPENVAFISLLEQKIGKDIIIENILLSGEFGEFYRAIHKILKSSRKTKRFFRLAQSLSREGTDEEGRILSDLLELLTKGKTSPRTGKVARRYFSEGHLSKTKRSKPNNLLQEDMSKLNSNNPVIIGTIDTYTGKTEGFYGRIFRRNGNVVYENWAITGLKYIVTWFQGLRRAARLAKALDNNSFKIVAKSVNEDGIKMARKMFEKYGIGDFNNRRLPDVGEDVVYDVSVGKILGRGK